MIHCKLFFPFVPLHPGSIRVAAPVLSGVNRMVGVFDPKTLAISFHKRCR